MPSPALHIALLALVVSSLGCGRVGYDLLSRRPADGAGTPGQDAALPRDAAQAESDAYVITPVEDAGPRDASVLVDASADASLTDAGDAAEPGDAMSTLRFGGHSYVFLADPQNWSASAELCRDLNMHLVHIESAAEQDFVYALNPGRDFWTGGIDSASEGVWIWTDGGPQFWAGGTSGAAVGGRFTAWVPGVEPNNAGGAEDCAVIDVSAGGSWADVPCSLPAPALCESF